MKKQRLTLDGASYTICLPHADTDYIQGKIVSTQEPYELDMLRDMASRLQPGDLVLDVGANVGNHSLYLANVAGVQVEAFEPNTELCEALRSSAVLNGIGDRLRVHKTGVSDASGFAHFNRLDASNLGAQSLEVSQEQDDISLVTLDQFEWLVPVRMIKVDVEGMELQVLRGATAMLERDRPILYIEGQTEADFTAVNQLLNVLGYQYCSTFNATPTHLFLHNSEFTKITDLGSYLTEMAHFIYRTNHNLSELRSKLKNANDKYRDATSQIAKLKNELATQNLLLKQVELDRDSQLKQVRQLQAEAQRSLSAFKSSATYKAGLYMRAATSSYNAALKLPWRLWRLRKQGSSKPITKEVFSPVKTLAPAAEVTIRKDLYAQSLKDKPAKKIRVACVMDDFTFGSYQPECNLCQLTPENWQTELETFKPELLFIESAWHGKDELWGSKIGHCSHELQGIVAWCRERHIPTVFWNKEDPVHFETFLTSARLFDFVFTTDMDCIHRYKAALGHERVYFLPFACQPNVHNPIEKYPRKDAFCFAGAYYVRYPERTRDLESFVKELPVYRPLEIYDRNFGKNDPNYQFPEAYQSYIVGTLPFAEIDKAYKGYRYAINLNSIKQSQTMFARRVYELLGSNTLTISNYSRGVRLLFGDLVITSDSGAEIKRRLERLNGNNQVDRLRLAGLRKVMAEHTYADRFNYLLAKVTGEDRQSMLPAISVVAMVNTPGEVKAIVAHVARQRNVELNLTLVISDSLSIDDINIQLQKLSCPCKVLTASVLKHESLQELAAAEKNWIAGMLPGDYYGPHYLQDMVLATRYSKALVIGKTAQHICNIDNNIAKIALRDASEVYVSVQSLYARCSVIAPAVAQGINAIEWLEAMENWQYQQSEQLAIDPYNYCQNVSVEHWHQVAEQVDDLPVDLGVSLESLIQLAESIVPMKNSETAIPHLNGNQLAQLLRGEGLKHQADSMLMLDDGVIRLARNKAIQTQITGSALEIASRLPDGQHEYLYAVKDTSVAEVRALSESHTDIPLHLEADLGLNLSLVVLFLNSQKARIGSQILQSNRNVMLSIPEDTAFLRFGLRVYAGGGTCIKRLLFGHLSLEPANVLGQSDILLLTNHYPSYNDLYRNGFVHSRVTAYAEKGVSVDVFRLRKDEPISWHEFQDIDVTTGSQQALRRMLQSGRYRHVLVHFLDPDMWDVLKEFIDDIKVTVWVHGAEIHPWYRRKFNIETPEQEKRAKEQSEIRMAFWKGLLQTMPVNLHMVFVSNSFAQEVMEDLGLNLPENQYSIIHNPIDTDKFTYEAKEPEQRKKILSIRPYSSRTYANDLSVKAVLELSKECFFSDLQFKFIGDGVLFDETLEPIKSFDNVCIERRFLSQQEIATTHKEYGIFLCPSRMDTQGVSRDEAMSSGLVPVTNSVAAIPEFVDDSCGVLAPAEDYQAMAEGIALLYQNPDVFKEKSQRAAQRVREQTQKELIVDKEIRLLNAG